MPGIIQVSVLDFGGLHSPSPSSQISLKVSMGKTEYQTWDKGDFTFPLTGLRDNLIVTLEDAEGNKISHTGVETRLVVEKGVWDDIFHLEGGGNIHMKLQFVLNEEDRQRIRIMRESAIKKKCDELCNSGHASPKNASVGYNEVSANEATLLSMPSNFFKDAKFDIDNKDGSDTIQKQKSTNDRNEKEVNSSSKFMPQASNVHQDSAPSKLEKVNNLKKQGPTGKANSSSTVKKMISAFEGSLNQDKPSIKPPPKKPETRKIGVDSFVANPYIKEVETDKIRLPNATLGRTNTNEFELTITSKWEKAQKIGLVKPMYEPASTIDQKAAFSRRMLDKHSKSNQSWNSFSKKQHSSRTLVTTKEGGEEISLKNQQEAEGTLNEKLKSATTWKWIDDHCSSRSSGLWIFPGESKCLCITTEGKKVMDLMGGFWDEPTREIKREVNANASEAIDANEDGKTSTQKLRPRLENSMEPEESIGPFRQVIRVVIMVGFATLVLLTRKRT